MNLNPVFYLAIAIICALYLLVRSDQRNRMAESRIC